MSMHTFIPSPAAEAGRHAGARWAPPVAPRRAGPEPLPLVDRLAAEALRAACLGSGMRVLDAGCGSGALSLLVASIVGPGGRVVGADRSNDAIRAAALRAAAAGRTNLRFVRGEAAALEFEAPFDAVICRSLTAEADPAHLLRGLVRHLKPGGVLAVQALATEGGPVRPSLFDRINVNAECSAAEMHTAIALSRHFRSAGLRPPSLSVAADLDGLTQRLRDEAAQLDPAAVLPPLVSAWSRV
jgi:SAM-dependent methyltransferase